VGYVGAGTVEFIADGRDGLRPDRFFFMEMNTRLQVEHPVTEAITGLDLVELQFRVAAGEKLPFTQEDLAIRGHAVEARLYAEDPEREFLPSTGKLWALRFPDGEGLRVDSGVREGDAVTPFYDPMIAKLIAHGATRDQALDRLAAALGETVVAGPKTNLAFLKGLCESEAFRRERFDTGLIDRNLVELGAMPQTVDPDAVAAGATALLGRPGDAGPEPGPTGFSDPWAQTDAFQLDGERVHGLKLVVEGESVEAELRWGGGQVSVTLPSLAPRGRTDHTAGPSRVVSAGDAVLVLQDGRQTRVALHDPFDVDLEHIDQGGAVKAPMHGKLVAVFVSPGDRVEKGQRLAIVEAMKMEHALLAPSDGEVLEVSAEAGAQVAEGARLIVIAQGE
jgi:3-methylcrotonyl-CoA carboxylase alpha subunit